MRKVATIYYLKPEGKERLRAMAKAEGLTVSELTVALLNDGLRYRREGPRK